MVVIVTDRGRMDLSPLRPEDASALRRYAVALERKHPKRGFAGDVIASVTVKMVRETADRLDAGDLRGRR